MATAVCQKEKVGMWSSIFPEIQKTPQQSAFFVKKLLAVSVSYLTYLRNIFPETAYGDRFLDDMNLKILQESGKCPGANKVCHWIRSCFEALEKKYLNRIILGVYVDPADPNTLLESYSFKFNYEDGIDIYHNDKKVLTAETSDTKKSTTHLLRTILVLTQGLRPLPDNVMLTMKLLFNDDVTPPDYQPSGFIESKIEKMDTDHRGRQQAPTQFPSSDDFTYDENAVNIKVGSVSTRYHTVKMKIRTNCHDFELSPDTKEVVAEISSQNSQEEPIEESACEPTQDCSQTQPNSNDELPKYQVECVCGCTVQDGMLLLCLECDKWSHGVCYRVISDTQAPENHICVKCPGRCTDETLKRVSADMAQATAIWRRTLIALTEVSRVKLGALAQRLNVTKALASKLMTRLKSEKFIAVPRNNKNFRNNGYVVNQEDIKSRGITLYFTQDTDSMIKGTESLSLSGNDGSLRKRSYEDGPSSQSSISKRVRSSEIRTPIAISN